MKKKRPTRQQRAKVRAALMKKYWGNAHMGTRPGDDVKTISFCQLQFYRRESWEHGMKMGLAAGVKLAVSAPSAQESK